MKIRSFIIFSIFFALLFSTADYAQLFQQQFSVPIPCFKGSAVLTDTNYINATTPNSSQFTYLSTGSTSMYISGDGDTLTMKRSGGGTAYLVRNFPFSGPPTALKVKMDFNLKSTSGNSSSSPIHFYVGGSAQNSNTATDTSNSHSKFQIGIRSSSGAKWFVWPMNTTSSYPASPTLYSGKQTVTFVINNSGSALTYTAPTGSTESLANDTWDLWVGNTREINDWASSRPDSTLKTFKFWYGASTTSEITLDNMLVETVTAITPPATQASNISFSAVEPTSLTINWSGGDGAARAVFVKEGAQGSISNPVAGTTYSASTDWISKGTQLGSSEYYCVYNGTGTSVTLTNLSGGTTYWVQGFEYNGSGATSQYNTSTAVGNPNSQSTSAAVLATVATTAASSVTATTASSGGNVTSSGGAGITARGVCYSVNANPTLADQFTSDGTGTGTFASSLSGLTPSTLYHVRAYATNSVGTAYGADEQFTTSGLSTPTVTTTAATNVGSTTASSGGNVVSDGGASVTNRGVCWNTGGSPTISDSHTNDGTGTGTFTSSITGLNPGVTYYVRAFATNSVGTGYGTEVSFSTTGTFYNLASSDVTNVNNWGTNTDGTGLHPSGFSSDNATFNLFNTGSTMSANWTVSGANSKVILGDGTNAVTFTIPASASFSGTIDGANNSTLTFQHATVPTLGTMNGTAVFDGTIAPAHTYTNLSLANGGNIAGAGTVAVAGVFSPGSVTSATLGSTIQFSGSTAQTVPAFSYVNLDAANSAGCVTSGNVTVTGTLTVNQNFTITAGDTLVLSGSTPMIVASSKTLAVNGVIWNQSTGTVTLTGTMTVSNGASYIMDAAVSNSYILPAATYAAGSSIYILQGGPRFGGGTFNGDIYWNSTGAGSFLNQSSVTFGGNFTMNAGRVNNGSGGTGRTLIVNGNITLNGGEYDVQGSPGGSGNQICTVNGNIIVNGGILRASHATTGGSGTINAKGNVTVNSGMFGDSTGYVYGTIVLNGTSAQTVSNSDFGASSVTVNNAAGISLSQSTTVRRVFTLTSGIVSLNNNNFTFDTSSTFSGSVSATAFIAADGMGEVIKKFAGTGSFVFPLGEQTGSAEASPMALTLSSGTFSNASVGVKVKNLKHPSNTSTTSFLNRYWQVSSTGLSGFSATLKTKYNQADVAGTEADIYMGKWSGSSWTAYAAANTTDDTLSAFGVSSFGDFTGGEAAALGGVNGVISMKFIPEGYFDTGVNRLNMKDTFKVYLANISSPYALVDSAVCLIDSVSFSGDATFVNAPNGTYYVVVKGRNIIETWSKTGGETFTKGSQMGYDFTTAAAQSYGSNAVLKGSKWCVYSGDVAQDGFIDFSDLSAIDNDQFNFIGGYVQTDITGDQFVDFSDLSICDNNQFNFVGTVKPGGKSTTRPFRLASPRNQ